MKNAVGAAPRVIIFGKNLATFFLVAPQEVPGSAGTTNLFNLVAGKVDIPFTLKETPDDSGRLSILRWVSI